MKNITTLLKNICVLIMGLTFVIAQNNVGWQPLGPVEYPVNNIGQINGIARVSQIKFHPSDPKTMYAVTSMGGLFISKDEGNNWSPMGTDFIPQARNASVCIDYTDDRILYFSTGDPHYYSQYSGIWKSTNGGKNWTQSNSGIGNRMAVEMLMSPLDHNVIIAATNDGIWKTTNGGTSWSVKKSGGNFTDMVFKPVANSSTIYAISHTEFWVSNDMGENWTRTTISGSGIERGGRVAVSKADANVVYITFVGNFDGGTATPVWKSTNSGASFSQVRAAGNPNLNGYDGNAGGQGNYNYFIAADPTNANILYIGGHIIWKSTNGGVSWTQATRSWATRIHTDMHQMTFSPYKPNYMYNANDGGIYLSTDGGFVWQIRSNGLAALESYCGAQNQLSKGIVMAGSQDNGAVIFRNTYWATNMGGDVHAKMECDYLNANSIYLLNGNGRRKSSVNGGETNMNFPVAGNDGNGNDKEMEFTPLNTSLGFVSHREVYRTTNLGSNPPTWTQITSINAQIKALGASPADVNVFYAVTDGGRIYRSDNVTAATPSFVNLAAPGATNVRASIAPIKNNVNVVYVTCGNRVYRSGDKGASWTNVSGTLPAVNIFKIIHDRYSTNEAVYIATALGVYYKDNTMSDWINYSKDLPSIAEKSKLAIYNDGTANSELRVITGGRGVWRRALYNNVILRPADNPASTSSGLRYEYFEGYWKQIPNFNSLVPVKAGTANAIDISQRNRDDGFGLRFKGYVNVPSDGIYTFHVNSDDGCIVYIGDQVIVDNNGLHGNETEVTGSIGLKAGKHAFSVEYFEDQFGNDLLVQYSGPGVSKQAIPGSALFRLPDPAICSGTGSLTYEIWHNVTGGISSIPVGTTPTVSRTVGDFELAQDYGDSYGSRARGFICAPYTGNYTFWIASDDDSELWLSTDANPANKRKIANLAGATALRNWYYSSSQQSAPIALVAGQKYYIESLHRDGGGDDNCSVGWQLPSGEYERPIAAIRLSPFTSNTNPTVSITSPPNNSTFTALSNITFDATAADADGSVTKVEFFRNGISIGFDNTTPYSVTWNSAATGSYQITAIATDDMGGTGTSAIVNITVNDLRTPENPLLTTAGLDYKYYEGNWSALPDFNTLTAVKTGTVTTFDLTPRNINDQFGFSFTGFINVPTDGQYTFYTASDDGSKLFIGSTQVVNNDGLHGAGTEVSGTIGLKAGKHALTVNYFEQGGGEQITVSYAGPGITKQIVPSSVLFRIPPVVACSGTGTMTREVWTGITGTNVSAIPVATVPSSSGTISLFEGPVDAADNYGSRLKGYLCAPYTGAYTFWIASDDDSELWLSTDNTTANKTLIASNTGWVNYRAWDTRASQKSATINLTAGQKYYVEALHKDGGGGDHVSVGWQLPTGVMERPITGNRVSPYINVLPTVSLSTEGTSFNAPATVNLTATAADADGSVLKVEFMNGTSPLGEDATAPYAFTWNNVAAGTYTLTAKVYDNSGAVISSSPVNITVVNPSVTVGTVYQHCDYSTAGYAVALEAGDYNLAALQAKGIVDNDISSLKVSAGYEIVLYKNNNFTGASIIVRADDNCLTNEIFNDSTTSLRIRVVTNNTPTVNITAPANGSSFTTGTTITLTANAADSDGSITKVEYFRGATPIGSATASPYTVNWTGAAAGSYSVTAVATDNSGAQTTSNPVAITVVNPNVAPTVSITAPTNGSSFTTGTTITLTANGADSDGSITKVEYFRGATPIGSATTSPYTVNWTGAAAGAYTITAVATDNSGAQTTSNAVSITVNTPNTPPAVSITAPSNNQSFSAPATINIAANASDNGGTVTLVQFYRDGNYLGEDATSPYTFSWTNVAGGTYSITAKATDNSNATTTSTAVMVVVNAADNCSGLSVYVENSGYVEGSQVKNGSNIYQCRAWPNSGWCNGASWAYAPGTGTYWTDAWTLVGPCTTAPIPTGTAAVNNEMEVTTLESYPNPFEAATTIRIKNKVSGNVSVVVVNTQGVKVAELFNGQMKSGSHELIFDASGLAEGNYYCRIVSETNSKVISLSKVNRPKMKF